MTSEESKGPNTPMKIAPILDPLYKLVEIPPLCAKFINTEEFRRLSYIKQLGMTYIKFPSANHTRAEHSIGVMHLSGEFYSNLLKNSDAEWQDYIKYKIHIQLAGLLHDLGHGPISHLFEDAMKMRGVSFCHEDHSVYLINRINDRLGLMDKEDIALISAIIKGEKRDGYPDFMFEIVANNEHGLDTDKMDYLRRDAYHVGKPLISVDYMIKQPRIQKTQHIAYPEHSRSEIDTLFLNRKQMYEDVYFNAAVIAADKTMLCALCQIDIDFKDPDCFFNLDDNVLYYTIRSIKHDIIRCFNENVFDHHCDNCPTEKLIRVATLSGDTSGNPMRYIRFY